MLTVDQRAATRGAVLRVSIETPTGDWNRFELREPRYDRALDAATFRFTPPPGARDVTAPAPR